MQRAQANPVCESAAMYFRIDYFLKRLRESYFSITTKWSGTTLGNMTSAPLKVDEPGHTQNLGVSAVSAASVEKVGEAGTST